MPTKAKTSAFPQFDNYACVGDDIRWEHEGYDFVARLMADIDSHVNDSGCYSKKQIEAWKNDEWFFVGVVVSVSKNNVELSDYAASLWGIDCNFPSRKKNTNTYLSEVAHDLQGEALDFAKIEQARINAALS